MSRRTGQLTAGAKAVLPAASAVAQVGEGRVAAMSGLAIFAGRRYLCGPAVTCACVAEDNLALHGAIAQAAPGSVVVCASGGTRRGALLGELMATDAINRGLAGVVLDGPVRDLDDIDRIGFPVLAAGTALDRTATLRAQSVGEPVIVGGVRVSPGDQVVADQDGAVVVPALDWFAVWSDVAALSEREERMRDRLAAGELLADVLGLDLRRAGSAR